MIILQKKSDMKNVLRKSKAQILIAVAAISIVLCGCGKKEENVYSITEADTNVDKEEAYLKYLANKSEEVLSTIDGVKTVNASVSGDEEQGYSVNVAFTTFGSLSDVSLNQIKIYLENSFVIAKLFIDGMEVPLGGVTGIDSNTESEYPALIRVSGRLYYDCAEISTEGRCGMLDGTIDSVCDGDIPTKDNQSNFGKDYGYQFGVDTVEVLIDDEWHIFKKFDYDEWNILPEYVYSGDDPIEKAITEYYLSNNYHYEMKPSVAIPAFCIFMSEADENDSDMVKVYGNYWLFVYEKVGTTLENISGGEAPGVMYVKKNGDEYGVDHFEQVRDGSYYTDDIKAICNGNKSLEDQFFGSSDAMTTSRTYTIKKYVEMFDLDIDAYHDYGWDKVMLSDYTFDGVEE